jgi:glycosyltransferase involved in cell wall biosynthesis
MVVCASVTGDQYQLTPMSAIAVRIRIVRVIARLNIGGPAIQAITLTRLLDERGYQTRLVRGRESATEASMDYLAEELGVAPTLVTHMRRDPGPGDAAALAQLVRILRADRPHIVHTHAAKSGTLGRVAALLAFPRRSRRPVLVHTFHGQSLTGYFDDRTAGLYRRIERLLAHRTDALVVVSAEVRDDLVRLGVAERERFTVVPLGFDLGPFVDDSHRDDRRARLRREWGIDPNAEVVTLIARLVPIKRVDRFLAVARMLAAQRPRTRFVVVGDGELREPLRTSEDARALGKRLTWAGFRRDMPDVCFASDLVVLTSDNEGTPVSLIEAQAAAVPVVGTAVGGVPSAVRHGETGLLAPPGDERALAEAIARILDDEQLAGALARAGREHAQRSFVVERLLDDLDRLYRGLLAERKPALVTIDAKSAS